MNHLSKALGAAIREVLSLLLLLIPTRRSVVVFTAPVMEGNAVEVVRWLNRNYEGCVTWLIADEFDPGSASGLLAEPGETLRVRILPKKSTRAFIAWSRAELVLFTYLLYRGPTPRGNRTFVNLWHGDGPKPDLPPGTVSAPAQITVAGTDLWGRGKVEAFGSPIDGLMVTGNPRIDQFRRPATDTDLNALGIKPDRPFVVWAPTFRAVRSDADSTLWSDSADLDPFRELRARADEFSSAIERLDLQVVIKRHALDAERYNFAKMVHIENRQLLDRSLGFYQLLARSAALITDYSSVWTDYLPLDRPIGLYCPDIEPYSRGRGFDVPRLEEFAPGPIATDVDGLLDFLRDVANCDDPGRELRHSVCDKIGAVTDLGATERLMRRLMGGSQSH